MTTTYRKNHKCSHCGSHAHTTVLSTLLYGSAEICTSCRLNNRVLYRRKALAGDSAARAECVRVIEDGVDMED